MRDEEIQKDVRRDAHVLVNKHWHHKLDMVEAVYQLMWDNVELRRSNDEIKRLIKFSGTQGAGGHPAQRE